MKREKIMTENNDWLSVMKDSRENPMVTFLDFINEKKDDKYAAHFFLEGEIDNSYYETRVERYFDSSDNSIKYYTCYSKKNAVIVRNKIFENDPDDINKSFFIVDKDYTEELNNEIQKLKNMYITPYHSLETFYATKETFITTVLRENVWNTNDKKEVMKNNIPILENFYDVHLQNYLKKISFIGAWFFIQDSFGSSERNSDLSQLKINLNLKLAKQDRNIDKLNKEMLFNLTPNYFDVTDEDIESYRRRITENPFVNLRGKYFLPFIYYVLQNLMYKKNSYVFENKKLVIPNKKRFSVGLVDKLSGNELNDEKLLLRYLSMYAQTPTCLISFLKRCSDNFNLSNKYQN